MAVLTIFLYPSFSVAADPYDADISVLTSPSTSVDAGADLTYIITVSALSGDIKKDIEITNTFNADMAYVFGSTTGAGWTCSQSTNSVICTYDNDINASNASTFSFTIRPTANGTTTSITNTVSLTATGNTDADTDLSNNTRSITTIVNPVSNLSVSKSAASSVYAEDPLTYTINVQNLGQYDTQNVTVTDTLPAGSSFTGFSAPSGWNCLFNAGTFSCSLATMPSGYNETITLNTNAPSTPGSITNTVSIISDNNDPYPSNNTDNATTTVNATSADLSLTKTVSAGIVNTTAPIDYTLHVENHGPNSARNVRVTDTLPSTVLFVSINGGSDWSCSQGSQILCDYVANGGILPANTTPSDIQIRVTAPTTGQVVTNSASVTSTTLDNTPGNNTSTVDVTVDDALIVTNNTPLEKYLQYNIFGDIKLIGNANINWDGINVSGPNNPPLYNDRANMVFVDSDSNGGTFNSSQSKLEINASHEILWAGLYWEGHICTASTTGANNIGCRYDNMPGNRNTYNKAKDKLKKVKFKRPGKSYITIEADAVHIVESSSNNRWYYYSGSWHRVTQWDLTYSAFKDVTDLVSKRGIYKVANIALTEGSATGGGNYGGWAMLVIYKDPSRQLHFKNISVFNGFQYINSDNNPVAINGFITPKNGPINASIAFLSADGDPANGGVGKMRVGLSNTFAEVSDSKNPAGNLMNSTITELGNEINSGVTKTYGVDADRIDVSSFMTNDQTETEFRFDVTNPNDNSQVDYYSLSMFAFATDLPTPIINNFSKSAVIVDSNGTRVAGPSEPLYPGNELIYTIEFTNTGDEIATEVEIFDDFDFDNLTPALALENFDLSRLHLYQGTDTNTPPLSNACGYAASDHRVFCRLDHVDPGETYTMQFAVRLKNPLDISLLDANATNTAYARYKNINTNTYVILVNDSHGDFGGKSNSFNAGILHPSAAVNYIPKSMDAINQGYDYNVDRNITTKIVNSPFGLNLVYIDNTGMVTSYQSTGYNMPVLLTLCSKDTVRLVPDGTFIPEFTAGTAYKAVSGLNLQQAHRNDRVKMGFIDWSTLNWANIHSACTARSTTNGNFLGVPQCLNSASKLGLLFPVDEYPEVHNVCLGEGLTLSGNQVSACTPSAYAGTALNPSKTIMPEKYRHIYGCFQCLTDAYPEFTKCSTDNFAARPQRFSLSSTQVAFPDLLRSGRDYNLSLVAEDALGNPTQNYDQYKNSIDVNGTLYLSTGTPDTTNMLEGNLTLGYGDFNITNGISVAPGTGSNEVVSISYNDVAKVGFILQDPYWAQVDNDDTPQDCTTTIVTHSNGTTDTVEAPAYICGDFNATFIPDHFDVVENHIYNHAQGGYTYLSNDLNMSVHVTTVIKAMNAKNGITKNFRTGTGYYEHPVSVDMNVTTWKGTGSVHPLGNPAIIKDITPAVSLGFGGADANGTHTIAWNDANSTQQLLFNYKRDMNQPVDPFDVNGSDVNLTVVSTYTGTAPEGVAVISGTGLADNNATFIYARAHASKPIYDNVISNAKQTPIIIDVYCMLPLAACQSHGINTALAGTNSYKWWLALDHNMSMGYGNIELSTSASATVTQNPSVHIEAGAKDETVTVTAVSATRPLSVDVDLVTNTAMPFHTDSWLIYNKDLNAVPSPFYKVIFVNNGAANWTGFGQTGHVVDTNVSTSTNKRLEW